MSFFLLIQNNIVFVNTEAEKEINVFRCVCVSVYAGFVLSDYDYTVYVYAINVCEIISVQRAQTVHCVCVWWLQFISLNIWNSNGHNLTHIYI